MGLFLRPGRALHLALYVGFVAFVSTVQSARAADLVALAPTVALPEAPEPRISSDAPAASHVAPESDEHDGAATNETASLDADALAFHPAVSSSSSAVQPLPDKPSTGMSQREIDLACQAGTLHGKPCRASWGPILFEFLEATAIENGGNIALDDETRHDLVGNDFVSTWFKCVRQFRYDQWRDDDGFVVDYVAHGMQGGIVGASFLQHSPTGRGLVYVNNGNYWRSRLKAMAWMTIFEVQWKIGPASEASIGNSGLNTYFTPRVKGRSTNETGFQDFVDTPVLGFGWNIGEDALDRFVMPHIWQHTHNKLALSVYSVLTPCKSMANVLRFKPLYYRDFDLPPVRR